MDDIICFIIILIFRIELSWCMSIVIVIEYVVNVELKKISNNNWNVESFWIKVLLFILNNNILFLCIIENRIFGVSCVGIFSSYNKGMNVFDIKVKIDVRDNRFIIR